MTLENFHFQIYLAVLGCYQMTSIVLTSIIAFTTVISLLVFILLFAQSKLVQAGPVNLIINGDNDNPVVTSAGTSLLSSLSSQKIFLLTIAGKPTQASRPCFSD